MAEYGWKWLLCTCGNCTVCSQVRQRILTKPLCQCHLCCLLTHHSMLQYALIKSTRPSCPRAQSTVRILIAALANDKHQPQLPRHGRRALSPLATEDKRAEPPRHRKRAQSPLATEGERSGSLLRKSSVDLSCHGWRALSSLTTEGGCGATTHAPQGSLSDLGLNLSSAQVLLARVKR